MEKRGLLRRNKVTETLKQSILDRSRFKYSLYDPLRGQEND